MRSYNKLACPRNGIFSKLLRMPSLLNEEEIRNNLASVPAWDRDGSKIVRSITLADFASAIQWVNQVADLAEKANHHPDIDIRWNKVRLSLSTHSKGGLTENDFLLARQIDQIA